MYELRDYILQVLACVAAAAYLFHLHFIELGAINWFLYHWLHLPILFLLF